MTESDEGSLKVLLEDMNDKFSLVLEGHDAIRQEFKNSHRELEEKINLNSSLIKIGFETLDAKIDGVRTDLKEEIQGVRTDLKAEIQGVRTELKAEIQGVRTELKAEIQGVRTEIKETRDELSAKIDAVGVKVDGHDDRIRFLERKVA